MLPFIIWFITSQDWWRYAILSPIILLVYQLWEVIESSNMYVDEASFFKALPLIVMVVILLLVISKAVNYQSKILDTYDIISAEIEELIEKIDSSSGLPKNEEILKFLKQENNKGGNERQKINDLVNLKEELIEQLKTKT